MKMSLSHLVPKLPGEMVITRRLHSNSSHISPLLKCMACSLAVFGIISVTDIYYKSWGRKISALTISFLFQLSGCSDMPPEVTAVNFHSPHNESILSYGFAYDKVLPVHLSFSVWFKFNETLPAVTENGIIFNLTCTFPISIWKSTRFFTGWLCFKVHSHGPVLILESFIQRCRNYDFFFLNLFSAVFQSPFSSLSPHCKAFGLKQKKNVCVVRLGRFYRRWGRFRGADLLALSIVDTFSMSLPLGKDIGIWHFQLLFSPQTWIFMFPSSPQQECIASSDSVYSAVVVVLKFLKQGFRCLATSMVYTGGLTQVMGYKISLWVVSQLFHLRVNLGLHWTSHPEPFNQPWSWKRQRLQTHLGIIFTKQHF